MTITRADVADLRAGDVVELSWSSTDDSGVTVTVRGPIKASPNITSRALFLGSYGVRDSDGDTLYGERRTLTVISRAKPPLYVNSDKTEPDPGDVVRDADDPSSTRSWHRVTRDFGAPWGPTDGPRRYSREQLPARLRLLIDGRTGQTVPPQSATPA